MFGIAGRYNRAMAKRHFTALPFDDHALTEPEWERRALEIEKLARGLGRFLPRWQLARVRARLRAAPAIG